MPTDTETTTAAPAGERLVWLDLLRIAASLLIVMLNITANQLRAMPIEAPGWQTVNLYLAFSRAATPLFTMMSGVLFLGLGKQRSLKQLFQGPLKKIVVIYFFWSFLYAIFLYSPNLRYLHRKLFRPCLGERWKVLTICGFCRF